MMPGVSEEVSERIRANRPIKNTVRHAGKHASLMRFKNTNGKGHAPSIKKPPRQVGATFVEFLNDCRL